MPKVSVILPFLNAANTLDIAIRSVLRQSFTDYEMILVNNKSQDESPAIAEKYCRKDSRLKLVSENKSGIVPALLTGFSHCSGKYIARMDADDLCAPERLKLQTDFLDNNPEFGLVSSQVRLFPASTSNMGLWRYVKWQNEIVNHEDMLVKCFVESPVVHPSIVFRKEVAEKYGYVNEGDFPEDYELFLRWLDKGVLFHKINKVLFHWRDSAGRLTRTDKRYRQEAFFKVKMDYLVRFLQRNNPSHPEIYVWGAGKYARKRRQLLEKKGIVIKAAFEVDPAKVDNRHIFHYSEIPERGNIFIVSLVSNKGAGDKIKEYLNFIGYEEGKDFILAG